MPYVSLKNVLKVVLGLGLILGLMALARLIEDAYPAVAHLLGLLGWPVFLLYLVVGSWRSFFAKENAES
ncbi:MAG TPA: hypothetical protein VFT46_08615 [Holophagaceae bacterium]|nr:hypothetical protein [Holophagaceae bacterium]